MRHGKKFNHLKRKSAHRKATLRNLSIALITHKRINTTLAKAKALRVYIEPLVTKAKSNTTHSRRTVFSYLQNKEVIKELFDVIGPKVGDRPGGYVRVLKTGWRKGDGGETALIEFVDFNDVYGSGTDEGKSSGRKRRRRRRGGSGGGSDAGAAVETAVAENEEEVEEVESVEEAEDVVEEVENVEEVESEEETTDEEEEKKDEN